MKKKKPSKVELDHLFTRLRYEMASIKNDIAAMNFGDASRKLEQLERSSTWEIENYVSELLKERRA